MSKLTAHDIIEEMKLIDGLCDPWGSSIGLHFDVANHMALNEMDIPSAWEYSPGAFGPSIDEDSYYIDLLDQLDESELCKLGNILHRYEQRLIKQGKDY